MFNQIVNPVTNKPVKLNSKLGKKILENYTKISGQTGGKWHFQPALADLRADEISIIVNNPNVVAAHQHPKVTRGLKNLLEFIQHHGFAVICNSRGIKPDNVFKVYDRDQPNISGHIIDLHCASFNTKGLFMKLFVAPPARQNVDPTRLPPFSDFQLNEIGNEIGKGLSALHAGGILVNGQIDSSTENNRNLTSIKGFIVSDPAGHQWAQGQNIGGAIILPLMHELAPFLSERDFEDNSYLSQVRRRAVAFNTIPTSQFIIDLLNRSNHEQQVPTQRFAMIFMERLNVTWKSTTSQSPAGTIHPDIPGVHPGSFKHDTGYRARNINLNKYFDGLEGRVPENYVNDLTPAEDKPALVGLKRKLIFIRDIACGIKRLHDIDLCFNDLKMDNVGAILEADFETNFDNNFAFTPTARDIHGNFINQPNITLTGKIVDYGGVTTSNYSLETGDPPVHTPYFADWGQQYANPGLPTFSSIAKEHQPKADIYALGIIAFNMFPADSDNIVHELIMNGLIGSAQDNIIGTMLDKARDTRPTIQGVITKIDTLIHNLEVQDVNYIMENMDTFTTNRYPTSTTHPTSTTQPTPPPPPPHPLPPTTHPVPPTVPVAQGHNLQIQCNGFIGIIYNEPLNNYELAAAERRIANQIHDAARDVHSVPARLPPQRPDTQSIFYHCIIDEAYAIVSGNPDILTVARGNYGVKFLKMGMKKEGYNKLVFLLVQFLRHQNNAAFNVLTQAYEADQPITEAVQGHVPADIQVRVLECAKFPIHGIEYVANFSGDNDAQLRDYRIGAYAGDPEGDISIKTILDLFIQTHYPQEQIAAPPGSQSVHVPAPAPAPSPPSVSLPFHYTQVADPGSCLVGDETDIIGYTGSTQTPYLYKIKRIHEEVRQEIRCSHDPDKLIREKGATYSQLVWVYDPIDGNLREVEGITRDLKFIHNDCVKECGIFYKEYMDLDDGQRYITSTDHFTHICSGADEFDDGSIYPVLTSRDFEGGSRIPYDRTLADLTRSAGQSEDLTFGTQNQGSGSNESEESKEPEHSDTAAHTEIDAHGEAQREAQREAAERRAKEHEQAVERSRREAEQQERQARLSAEKRAREAREEQERQARLAAERRAEEQERQARLAAEKRAREAREEQERKAKEANERKAILEAEKRRKALLEAERKLKAHDTAGADESKESESSATIEPAELQEYELLPSNFQELSPEIQKEIIKALLLKPPSYDSWQAWLDNLNALYNETPLALEEDESIKKIKNNLRKLIEIIQASNFIRNPIISADNILKQRLEKWKKINDKVTKLEKDNIKSRSMKTGIEQIINDKLRHVEEILENYDETRPLMDLVYSNDMYEESLKMAEEIASKSVKQNMIKFIKSNIGQKKLGERVIKKLLDLANKQEQRLIEIAPSSIASEGDGKLTPAGKIEDHYNEVVCNDRKRKNIMDQIRNIVYLICSEPEVNKRWCEMIKKMIAQHKNNKDLMIREAVDDFQRWHGDDPDL